MITETASRAASTETGMAGLARASHSLWLATLSLMTAFMHTRAPAHRYLLARRIARNFSTLRDQECFGEDARASFSRLASRWQEKAERLSPTTRQRAGLLARLQGLLGP